MKFIVAHTSPDLDAITSVWLIKKFLPGWEDALVKFIPAGERLCELPKGQGFEYAIEKKGQDEYIHVDTGLGPLDHHQTSDQNVCAASLTLDYVTTEMKKSVPAMSEDKLEALKRIVGVVTEDDHFREIFWGDPVADYHEFNLINILEGLKLKNPDQDEYYLQFTFEVLDAIRDEFDNRIWAEKEIKENGTEFKTRFGKGIGFKTINDTVVKLAQKMGYVVVVRKDPRKGYVRIKARPDEDQDSKTKDGKLDLTLVYEKLKKMDPQATWFLHVSKKMLLNGTTKNPKMKPTKLSLDAIIEVIKKI